MTIAAWVMAPLYDANGSVCGFRRAKVIVYAKLVSVTPVEFF